MSLRLVFAALFLVANPITAIAQSPVPPPAAVKLPQLIGLDAVEADALITRMQDLQSKLRRGEEFHFELLSGALAYLPMTRVSPRDAFLSIPFEKAHSIVRDRKGTLIWQPYQLVFKAERPDEPVWHVEVVLGFSDQRVMRISMVHRPPAPF